MKDAQKKLLREIKTEQYNTPEYKELFRKINEGKIMSPESRQKISENNRSSEPEVKKKISESLQAGYKSGRLKSWNKGKTAETDQRVAKYSGENNGMYGIKGEEHPSHGISRPDVAELCKQRIGEKNPNYGKRRTEEEKDHLREERMKQASAGDNNKLELKVFAELRKRLIPFETHKAMDQLINAKIQLPLIIKQIDWFRT